MNIFKLKILLLPLLFACTLQAQVSEYEYKAAFIERFTRFVEWPNGIDSDTFKIAVIGENPIESSLNTLVKSIKIKDRDVELIYTKEIDDLINANLVLISSTEKRRVKEILAFTDQFPILTISDSKGFGAKGVHINMYVDDNYIRYEINQESVEKSNLIVSSLLLSSAKIVKTDD